LQAEVTRARSTRHGHARRGARTPEYLVWAGMVKRCENPNDRFFARYGGRGISVCPAWRDFAAFLADMGTRPSSRHSIERRDRNGEYGPGNCYWATVTEQARNRSNNHRIEFCGETRTLVEWSERIGMTYSTLRARFRRGWSVERAMEAPCR